MRGAFVTLLVAGALVVGPSVAIAAADSVKVDAANVLVAAAWDHSACDVRVHRRSGGVNTVCRDPGSAAIMLLVPLRGVGDEGDIRSIHATVTGAADACSARTTKPIRVRHEALRLVYSLHGEFDCWYRTVRVRYRSGGS
jgi:hypothetical protein